MEAFRLFLFLSLLEYFVGGETVDIMNPTERCIATATQIGNCHVCVCKTDGVYHCRGLKCNANQTSGNSTERVPARRRGGVDFHSLPEIQDGEPCFPDMLYKMDCNTCRCTKSRSLMCTKMACFNWKSLKHKGKKALRSSEKTEKSDLPTIEKGMQCKPGKLYRSKCKRCYCTAESKLVCSQKPKDACTFDKFGNPPPILKPEDVHPPITLSDTLNVPSLHSASEQCTPGKTYKVDCNYCLCMDSGNLFCQTQLCLSYSDMNRIEAKEMSGKPCKPDEPMQSFNCKTCTCDDGKTLCTVVPDCKPDELLQLNGANTPPKQLDPETDKTKCIPNTIYKTDCNKCYCQVDGSLRCTQKTCLNYSQVKLLEAQRVYLERHGL